MIDMIEQSLERGGWFLFQRFNVTCPVHRTRVPPKKTSTFPEPWRPQSRPLNDPSEGGRLLVGTAHGGPRYERRVSLVLVGRPASTAHRLVACGVGVSGCFCCSTAGRRTRIGSTQHGRSEDPAKSLWTDAVDYVDELIRIAPRATIR